MSQDCGASAGPNGGMGVSAGDSVHSSPQVFIIQRWFERGKSSSRGKVQFGSCDCLSQRSQHGAS